jgi:hypothetical protein
MEAFHATQPGTLPHGQQSRGCGLRWRQHLGGEQWQQHRQQVLIWLTAGSERGLLWGRWCLRELIEDHSCLQFCAWRSISLTRVYISEHMLDKVVKEKFHDNADDAAVRDQMLKFLRMFRAGTTRDQTIVDILHASRVSRRESKEGSLATFKCRQVCLRASVSLVFSGCQSEKAVCELNPEKKIISCHPSNLPLPDHVDCFVALNGSPGRLKFSETKDVKIGEHEQGTHN